MWLSFRWWRLKNIFQGLAGFVVSALTVAAGGGRFGLRGGVPLIRFFNSGGVAAARFRCGFVAFFLLVFLLACLRSIPCKYWLWRCLAFVILS